MASVVGRVGDARCGMLGAGIVAAALLLGCGKSERDGTETAVSTEGEAGQPNEPQPPWPKRVTLTSAGVGSEGQPVRLADGVLAEDGDVSLRVGYSLSLVAPMADGDDDSLFCEQGTYPTLAEVPTDEQACLAVKGASWANLFLSGSWVHSEAESSVIGLSALVRNRRHDALYRLRILGDSLVSNDDGSAQTASATFEYEPVITAD